MIRTDLSVLMHALADKGHPRAAELREKADAFDAATHGFMELGTWARAHRLHCECIGKRVMS